MIQENCSLSSPSGECDIETPIGHTLSEGFTAFISTYFIILIIGSMIMNLLLILVIVQNRILHSSTNILFVNLAITDIITSLGVLPFDVDFLLRGYFRYSKYVCGVKETVFLISLPASIINLLLLTFDRFLLIVSPRPHRLLFTVRNIMLMIVFSWIYILIVSLYPIMYDKDAVVVYNGACFILFPHHYIMYELIANFSIPLVTIIMMNITMVIVSTQHTRIEQMEIPLDGGDRDSRVIALTVPTNFMSAKVIMIIVGECLLCWLTFIVLASWNVTCLGCHPRWLTWTGNAINVSAVVLNPILYGLLNSQIRTVITDKFRRFRSKVNEESEVLALHDESINEDC